MTAVTEVLFGYHAVKEALMAGRRQFSGLQVLDDRRNERLAEVARLAQSRQIPVQTVSAEQLRKFCKSRVMLKIDDSDIAGSTRRMDFWKKLY